jgi:hypothetical protein
MIRARLAGALGLSLGSFLLVDRWIIVLIIGLVTVLTFGVVLPAVWSAKPARRRAALRVLETLWVRGRAKPDGK